MTEETIFSAALDRAPAEWPAYLDEACAGDGALRQRVEELLRSHAEAGRFLAGPHPAGAQWASKISGQRQKLAGADLAPLGEAVGSCIGPYRLVQKLGEGGMGVVYLAEQERPLKRSVALKIVRPGMDSAQVCARFEAERQALALMDHPHIAKVLDAGSTASGRPYFVMELVKGVPITRYCDELRLRVRARLEMFVPVCQALQHAHQKGIIHRDIKPSNVLVAMQDGQPVAKVIDFGVAKALHQRLTEQTMHTEFGALVGTPEYMSPEQAELSPLDIDTRSDVYSLGVLLYELLTGSTPLPRQRLKQASFSEMLRLIRDEEPPTPSTRLTQSGDNLAALAALRRSEPQRLAAEVDGELDWIVMKAIDKDRLRRYETASALGQDIGRYLNDEPVEACPASTWYRLGKFARQQRKALAAALAFLGLLVLAVVISTAQAIRATRAETAALEQSAEVLAAHGRVREEAEKTRTERDRALEAKEAAQRTLADMHTSSGLVAADQNEPGLAMLWFASAARLARKDSERASANRTRVQVWGRQLPVPVLAVPPSGQRPTEIAFHPHGRYLMVLTSGPRCALWAFGPEQPVALPGGERAVSAAAFSPDGDWLVLGTPHGDVEIFRFPTGEPVHAFKHPGAIAALAFSPDGKYLAMASDKARVWDCRARAWSTAELPHPKPVARLTFNRRGDRLATGCQDGLVRVFSVPADEARPLFDPLTNIGPWERKEYVVSPVFIDDDRGLLTADSARPVRWWDAATGKEIRQISVPGQSNTCVLLPSPDGRHLAVCGYNLAQFWDIATATPTGQPMPQQSHAYAAAFSPDGARLLTVCDRQARLWSVPSGAPLTAVLSHQDDVRCAAFAADGEHFATAQADGLVRIWAVPGANPRDRTFAIEGGATDAQPGPDGRHLITTGTGLMTATLRKAHVYDVVEGKAAGRPLEVGGALAGAALSPDGRGAVTVSAADEEALGGWLQFWDWQSGQARSERMALPAPPGRVAYSPDGSRAVAVCRGGALLVVDVNQPRVVSHLQHGSGAQLTSWAPGVAFLPDGQSFVTWGVDHAARLWQLSTGEPACPPLAHGTDCTDASPSADGRLIVTASRDRTVRVWDVANGQGVGAPLKHPDSVFRSCFSADGKHVLTACSDGMARLWDWRAARQVCSPFKHASGVFAAALSPDGRWVLTSSWDRTARLWEWHTGKPLTPKLPLGDISLTAFFTADGAYAVAGGRQSALRAFHLGDLRSPPDPSPDDLVILAELLSGHRIHDGDVDGLTTDEWLERWQRVQNLEAGHPGYFQEHLHKPPAEIHDWPHLLARGQQYARHGEWQRAAADFMAVLQAHPDEHRLWCDSAPLCLLAGAQDSYRRHAQQMLDRFGATTMTSVAERTARACLLAPNAVGDLSAIERLADLALAGTEGHLHHRWYLLAGGLCDYRAGRYARAVERLDKAIAPEPAATSAEGVPRLPALVHLILAMAHHQLGQADEARRALATARDMMNQRPFPRLEDGDLGISWSDWAQCEVFHREAEALLKEPRATPSR